MWHKGSYRLLIVASRSSAVLAGVAVLAGCVVVDAVTYLLPKPEQATSNSSHSGSGSPNSGYRLQGQVAGLAPNQWQRFTDWPQLANMNPLANVSPTSSLLPADGNAIIPNVDALTNTAEVSRSGLSAGLWIEGIDPMNGQLLFRSAARSDGSFEILQSAGAPPPALIVQATLLLNAHLVGYEATSVAPPSGGSTLSLKLSPGSTAVVLANTLLAGIRSEFSLDRGFRGFASPVLGALLARLPLATVTGAVSNLDLLPSLGTLADYPLAGIVDAACDLSASSITRSAVLGAQLGAVLAAESTILSKVQTFGINSGVTPAGLIGMAATAVSPAELNSAYGGIVAGSGAMPSLVGPARPMSNPPASGSGGQASIPVASAEPGPGTTIVPSPSPSPGSSSSLVTSPQPGASPLAAPSPAATLAPSPNPSPTPLLAPSPTPNPTPNPAGAYFWVSTYAGSGIAGYLDSPASGSAEFKSPIGLAIDSGGTLYVADTGNNRIRTISPSGVVQTLAGSGTAGNADGSGTAAQFDWPMGLALDRAGNLYVADWGNDRIRKVTAGGLVSTLPGSAGGALDRPVGVAVDAAGNVFVGDLSSRIRKITPTGVVSTFAGSSAGYAEGRGAAAKFGGSGVGLAFDSKGNLYVADKGNNRIRMIAPDGTTYLVAGTGAVGQQNGSADSATFNGPQALALDAGDNIYLDEFAANDIRTISLGSVSVAAGDGTWGTEDGPAASAEFRGATGLAFDASGNLYIAETSNRIRKLTRLP